jgi:hypothetical protein
MDEKIREEYSLCFGILDIVFPKDKDGYRNTPETCFDCEHKTRCLREAMQGADGLKAREEFVDRAYASKMMGFFERWARKKAMNRFKKGNY